MDDSEAQGEKNNEKSGNTQTPHEPARRADHFRPGYLDLLTNPLKCEQESSELASGHGFIR